MKGTDRQSDTAHIRWPADRFYWAIVNRLPAGVHGRGRARDDAVRFLFEHVTPVPVEDLAIAVQRIGNGSNGPWIVCGVERVRLAGAVTPSTVSLTPVDIPAFLSEALHVNPQNLNVLTGMDAPPAVRRVVGITKKVCMFGFICGAALLATGFELRTAHLSSLRDEVSVAQEQMIETVFGDTASQLPPELRLTAEIRALDRAPVTVRDTDAARTMEAMFAYWPSQPSLRVYHLTVTAQMIAIEAHCDNVQSAQDLVTSLRGMPGWRAESPSIQNREDGTRLTLTMTAGETTGLDRRDVTAGASP